LANSITKRLAKRQKRKVARAQEKVKTSEPDLRTAEEIQAAREASRTSEGRRINGAAPNAVTSFRGTKTPGTGSAAKTAV
jgi:hypothetical protein